jgi:hypothetical protein
MLITILISMFLSNSLDVGMARRRPPTRWPMRIART